MEPSAMSGWPSPLKSATAVVYAYLAVNVAAGLKVAAAAPVIVVFSTTATP